MKINRRGGKVVTVYADGSISSTRRGGAGAILLDVTGVVIRMANRVLPSMTSTEAEYAALMLGLEMALDVGAISVELKMDNEVVVNQMSGLFAVNSPKLKLLHWDACNLARQLPQITYTHIPREQNALADVLAAEASAGRSWRLGCSGS